jgi:hypothetical protein
MECVARIATFRVLVVFAILFCAAPAASNEPRSGVEWLMREPVTLFDLGMHRLTLDVAAAARSWSSNTASRQLPLHGVYYDWRERRVLAYITIRDSVSDPTERICRQTFAELLETLVEATPTGSRRGATYLENLFLHSGPGNFGRPRSIGEELLQMVRLEITLLPPPPVFAGGRTVRCGGRLDAEPSTITVSVSE